MESIKDQSDIGTMIFNRIDVSLAHVTGSPFNFAFLVITKHFLKKTVDCLFPLTFTNPDNACLFNVINDGRIFMALAIWNFIDTNSLKVPYSMAVANAFNGSMQKVRKGGLSNVQQLRGSFLRHDLAIDEHGIFKAVSDAWIIISPRDIFLNSAVCRAHNFFGTIPKHYRTSV